MIHASVALRLALAAGASLLLAACSGAGDPKQEEPIAIQPGQYHVTIAGSLGMGMAIPQTDGPGNVDDSFCVAAGTADDLPNLIARKYLSLHDACTLAADPRVGNALSGSLSCPTDAERFPGGNFATTYEGRVSADRVELAANMKIALPESALANLTPEQQREIKTGQAMMEKLTLKVTAERTGDCS